LFILIIVGEEYKLWSFSLCSFLQPPVTSSLFGLNILPQPCYYMPPPQGESGIWYFSVGSYVITVALFVYQLYKSNCLDMSFSLSSVVVWWKNNLRISTFYDYENSIHCIKRTLNWWNIWQIWQFPRNWRGSWRMLYHRNKSIIIISYCVYVLYLTVSKCIMKCSY
jgi:hypothetical protein